ncbi:DivIVA domain-containing protein [Solwaraspora sp. WMMD406]|uniref:DivIVA domain-containing protein n=1 Tax=Solwaraspora sp. WMMD406 TaxID=3016095 RepID=UPI0024174980|nr:DivIVA domain-containing protein [Solwaraspora sp. WMMD406]MDG4763611.1 DivIVA domain-containing protein [Solwaraspora sp. WMMD406]
MRELWQRWRRHRMKATPPRQWPAGNGVHRVPADIHRNQRRTAYRPIRPWQIRAHRFPTATRRGGGRGLDPGEVTAFLDRVAHDLGILYAELDRTIEQNDRIKDALRRWQTSQATAAHAAANHATATAQTTIKLPAWTGAAPATRYAGQP